MVDTLVSFGKSAGQATDRWMHALRRRTARRRLLRHEGRTVLVVCQGNLCRSPFAEVVLRAALPADMEVRSAGFVSPGRCPPPSAVSAARRFGFDLGRHASRTLTAGLVRSASLIVVMEPSQAREIIERFGADPDRVLMLGDLDPIAIDTREIADPVQQSRDFFIDCYDRVDRCAREIGRTLHRAARSRAPMYGEAKVSEPTASLAN